MIGERESVKNAMNSSQTSRNHQSNKFEESEAKRVSAESFKQATSLHSSQRNYSEKQQNDRLSKGSRTASAVQKDPVPLKKSFKYGKAGQTNRATGSDVTGTSGAVAGGSSQPHTLSPSDGSSKSHTNLGRSDSKAARSALITSQATQMVLVEQKNVSAEQWQNLAQQQK